MESSSKMHNPKCDRCDCSIDVDKDTALCFNSEDEKIYLCEPCVEDIKAEFINELKSIE